MTMITKCNDPVSKKYGINPHNRTFEELLEKGYIVIDKDCGPTSHKTVEHVKEILNCEKAGHSGTLDPLVSGVLVVGLQKATRLMEYMLKSDKEYVCLVFIHKPVSDKKLNEVINQFIGKIEQLPPIISAVKRQLRTRTIYSIDVLEKKQDNQYVLFKVRCERGTYIRKLCTDIGLKLGVNAQMIELRRIKAGPKSEQNSLISVDTLKCLYELYISEKDEESKYKIEQELRTFIRPMEELLEEFKAVIVRDSAVYSIANGADLAIPGVLQVDDSIEVGDEVKLLTQKGELIAMGVAYVSSKNILKKDKGAAIKTQKVFIEKDKYPKTWF